MVNYVSYEFYYKFYWAKKSQNQSLYKNVYKHNFNSFQLRVKSMFLLTPIQQCHFYLTYHFEYCYKVPMNLDLLDYFGNEI